MLDIHCHILPGVDDGPQTLDEALTVARMCVRDGITHITATPHCHMHLRLYRAAILPHVAQLNQDLRAEGINLIVLPGSEIQLTSVEEYRQAYESGELCHLGDDPAYSLLEFPWNAKRLPTNSAEHIGWLLSQGTRAIIAHPERHGFFRENPDWLRAIVDAGAWLQITVDSLLGNHGVEAQTAGWALLEEYPEAVLATDAHRPTRCSGLSIGYRAVSERLGQARSQDLRARSDAMLHHLTTIGI